MKKFLLSLFLFIYSFFVFSQGSSKNTDSVYVSENAKRGFTFGALPALSYNSDVGFQYGGLVNIFYYGDGSTYPRYWHSLYLEWSQTTKGSGINQLIYDSDSLIKGVRTFVEASYLTEKLLDFYGYNGYESFYDKSIIDSENDDYISRLFYRQERKMIRLRSDFLGDLGKSRFKWFTGFEYNNIKLDTIDLTKVNEGKDVDEIVPSSNGGLFGFYRENNLIPENEVNGGITTFLKAGLVYDSRDQESHPTKGLWTEFQFLVAPSFLGNTFAYSKLILIHRQYIHLIKNKLTFAYRLNLQSRIQGKIPSYMLPFVYNSPPSLTRDGMGGSKTIRGALRNRIVGEDYLFGNFELRSKVINTVVLDQNFYLGINLFFDSGVILKPYEILSNTSNAVQNYLLMGHSDGLHNGLGVGFRFALNENFIVAADYGISLNKQDGDNAIYMGLNYLF